MTLVSVSGQGADEFFERAGFDEAKRWDRMGWEQRRALVATRLLELGALGPKAVTEAAERKDAERESGAQEDGESD